MPVIWPRRRFRSPITSPEYSSGVTTSTFMIGSSSTGLARLKPSLKPIEPAILNAISFESTSDRKSTRLNSSHLVNSYAVFCFENKDGTVERGANVRLIPDNVVVHDGKLSTLKRFKDEVKEVQSGQECGLAFEYYHDMRAADVL